MDYEETHEITKETGLAEYDRSDPCAKGTNPLAAVLLVLYRAATIGLAHQGCKTPSLVPIIRLLGTSGQEFTLDRRRQGAYKKVEALLSEPIFTLLPTGI